MFAFPTPSFYLTISRKSICWRFSALTLTAVTGRLFSASRTADAVERSRITVRKRLFEFEIFEILIVMLFGIIVQLFLCILKFFNFFYWFKNSMLFFFIWSLIRFRGSNFHLFVNRSIKCIWIRRCDVKPWIINTKREQFRTRNRCKEVVGRRYVTKNNFFYLYSNFTTYQTYWSTQSTVLLDCAIKFIYITR